MNKSLGLVAEPVAQFDQRAQIGGAGGERLGKRAARLQQSLAAFAQRAAR